MLFDKETYYKYIQSLENSKNATYAILIVIGIIIGAIGGIFGIIVGGAIGFFLANTYTLGIKIKIQKMKWEIDIYNKIHETKQTI